jgi:4-amino-4-deoxy-L-arabinose transferase-like glycosyltransferase
MLMPLEGNLFDTIAGLPVHALVVPLAAVLLPLGALLLILEFASSKLADRLGWFTVIILALGAGASWVAGESGQALAARVGEPQLHATLGRVLPFVAIALVVIATIWLIVRRRALKTTGRQSSGSVGFGVVSLLLAFAIAASTLIVAYYGIQAAWGTRFTPIPSPPAPVPSPVMSSSVPTPSTPGTPTTASGYTMAEVAQHNDQTSCWIVVSDQVYDITPWLSAASPGRDKALTTCGSDASSTFDDSATAPMLDAELATYLIGPLR